MIKHDPPYGISRSERYGVSRPEGRRRVHPEAVRQRQEFMRDMHCGPRPRRVPSHERLAEIRRYRELGRIIRETMERTRTPLWFWKTP